MREVVWAEVDKDVLSHNFREVKKLLSPGVRIMAVVKANGYGHGAYEVARVAIEGGATYLAVARLEEALSLREQGISLPILVFGPVPVDGLGEAIEKDITLTVFSIYQARLYSSRLSSMGRELKCHLKVDTGMGRLGVVVCERFSRGIEEIVSIRSLDFLKWEGIYTHFACADSLDLSSAKSQLELFLKMLGELNDKGIFFEIRHAANSAAIIQMPQSHLDMVRPGIMLYGIYPSEEVETLEKVKLMPAMNLRARIAHVKEVGKGFRVSYGSTYVTPRAMKIATIPVGYADGYPRILSGRGRVKIRGIECPILGRVCMDQFMVDVSALSEVAPGDEVLLFGRDRWGTLRAEKVATWANTIGYEMVSSLTSRVKRIYL